MNNNKVYRVLCFILVVCIKQEALAETDDKHDEVINDQALKQLADVNSSCEVLGPPDSHEAMNNREADLKVSSNREKRSYEFLMGLINNNSRYEVTNVDLPSPSIEHPKTQSAANEALLELLVKIAADPDQWEKVHTLLQKIDMDLKTSKKLLSKFEENSTKKYVSSPTPIKVNKTLEKKYFTLSNEIEENNSDNNKNILDTYPETNNNSTTQMQKMAVLLSDSSENRKRLKNETQTALKTNQWPRFEETEGHLVYRPRDNTANSGYIWKNKLSDKNYPRNFAYHRVTGNPFYHSNYDKNPKAYIAVSVIAPKPLKSRQGEEALILENELRQLKPWTHKQNLNNMAAIRSRWVIESDSNKNNNSTP